MKTNPNNVVLSIANLCKHADAKYESDLRFRRWLRIPWHHVRLSCRCWQLTPGFTTRLSEQRVVSTIQHGQQNSILHSSNRLQISNWQDTHTLLNSALLGQQGPPSPHIWVLNKKNLTVKKSTSSEYMYLQKVFRISSRDLFSFNIFLISSLTIFSNKSCCYVFLLGTWQGVSAKTGNVAHHYCSI